MQARRRSRLRSLYLWHRWLGLAAALPVFVIACTGLLLNHGPELGLDRRHVQTEWVLERYGMAASDEPVAFPLADESWLVWHQGRLFLQQRPLAEAETAPVGAVASPEGWLALAWPEALALYTPDGELVDRLEVGLALPAALRRLGLDAHGHLTVDTDAGPFHADEALLQWTPLAADTAVRWSRPAAPPAPLRQALQRQWRGEGPTWERLLLDIHSGRILGPAGVWLADAAALLLMSLAPTGLLLWLRARRRQAEHRRKKPRAG